MRSGALLALDMDLTEFIWHFLKLAPSARALQINAGDEAMSAGAIEIDASSLVGRIGGAIFSYATVGTTERPAGIFLNACGRPRLCRQADRLRAGISVGVAGWDSSKNWRR